MNYLFLWWRMPVLTGRFQIESLISYHWKNASYNNNQTLYIFSSAKYQINCCQCLTMAGALGSAPRFGGLEPPVLLLHYAPSLNIQDLKGKLCCSYSCQFTLHVYKNKFFYIKQKFNLKIAKTFNSNAIKLVF